MRSWRSAAKKGRRFPVTEGRVSDQPTNLLLLSQRPYRGVRRDNAVLRLRQFAYPRAAPVNADRIAQTRSIDCTVILINDDRPRGRGGRLLRVTMSALIASGTANPLRLSRPRLAAPIQQTNESGRSRRRDRGRRHARRDPGRAGHGWRAFSVPCRRRLPALGPQPARNFVEQPGGDQASYANGTDGGSGTHCIHQQCGHHRLPGGWRTGRRDDADKRIMCDRGL